MKIKHAITTVVPIKSSTLGKKLMAASMFIFASLISLSSHATVVEIRTNMGNIQVNLFDETTPQTVAKFLSYVNAGAYANSVSHRTEPNFIVQLGGFQYNGSFPPDPIATGAPVINEPELSNVRGTVAMAKLGGNPDSATSQFFFNVRNNSGGAAALDSQNGGFTVFGQVIGDGMDVVDAINALADFPFVSPFSEIPLRNYSANDFNSNVVPDENNLVIITDIVVIDAAGVTNPDLNPAVNSNANPSTPNTPPSADSGGGGAFGFGLIAGLLVITFTRRFSNKTVAK